MRVGQLKSLLQCNRFALLNELNKYDNDDIIVMNDNELVVMSTYYKPSENEGLSLLSNDGIEALLNVLSR